MTAQALGGTTLSSLAIEGILGKLPSLSTGPPARSRRPLIKKKKKRSPTRPTKALNQEEERKNKNKKNNKK